MNKTDIEWLNAVVGITEGSLTACVRKEYLEFLANEKLEERFIDYFHNLTSKEQDRILDNIGQ